MRRVQDATHDSVALPHLFGRGIRDRVLITLNANGPVPRGKLVRAIRCDEKKISNALKHFETLGVVTKRGKAGRRHGWTLDRRFFAYGELTMLLSRLGKLWPPPKLQGPSTRHGGPDFRMRHPTNPPVGLMFGSVVRTRVLVSVASQGQLNVQSIVNLVGARYESVHYCVRSLEQKGILRTATLGREVIVSLNDRFSACAELESFLQKLAKLDVV